MRQSTVKSLCQMSAHLFYVIFETLCVTVVYGPLGSGESFESKFTSQTCFMASRGNIVIHAINIVGTGRAND